MYTMHRRVGSKRGDRDPLQLVEHSGDADGVVPAIAYIPPHDAAPPPIFACCNVCGGPIRRRHVPSAV